jgi:chromosome segregation ATPase
MGFFTLGNILTLGIVGLVLVLYRQLDRQNHALNKVHRYADKLKIDLADFVAEKEAAVRDYGISLDVQQKSAKELMKRLQMTNEELALKAAAVAKIDERINAYDSSLEELVRMTGRVQENLNRIREESAFVEQVNKRVGEAKEKFVALDKGLGDIEQRFERENTDFLEKTAQSLTAGLESQILDLQAAAEGIIRRIEQGRAAIDQAERVRSEQVSRDLDVINNALQDVMEQIASEADKLEAAALVKLREQAQRRILQVQATIEESLKAHQEHAQVQVTEFQAAVTAYKCQWQEDTKAVETQQRSYKETLEKEVQALNDHIQTQQQAWVHAMEEGNVKIQQLSTELKILEEESKEHVTQETATLEQQLKDLQGSTERMVQVLEERFVKAVTAAEQRVLKLTDERIEQWKLVTAKAEDNSRNLLSDLEQASAETKERVSLEIMALEQQFKGVQIHTLDAIAALEQQLIQVAENTEQRVLELTDERLEHWKLATAEADANTQQMLSALELSTAEIKAHFAAETGSQEQRLQVLQRETDDALRSLQDQVLKAAADTEVKVLEDAGARLEQWKAAAEAGDARSQELLVSFEDAAGLLKTHVSKETAVIEQRLQDVQVHTDEAINALKSHVVKAVEDTQSKVWDDTEARIEQWKAVLEESEHQVRQMLVDLEAVSKETEGHISETLAGLEARIDTLQMKQDETTSHITEELAQAVETAEKQAVVMADAELEKWNRVVEAAESKAQQGCADLEASFKNTKQQVADEIAGGLEQCKAIQDQLQETVFRIEGELAQAVLSAEQKALVLGEGELNRWQQAAEAGDVKARLLLAEVERVSGEIKTRVFDELAVAEQQVETKRQRLYETADTMEVKILAAMDDAKDNALALVQAELEQWNRSAKQVHTQSQTLLANIETLAKEGEKNLADLEVRLVNMTTEAEQRFSESSDRRLEQWKLLTEDADTQTRVALASLETAVAETKTQVATKQATIQQDLEDLHNYTDERINGLKTQMEQTLQDTKQQVSDGITAAESRLDSLQQRLDETASSIDQGMIQAVSAAEERALALADLGLEKWRQTAETEDTAIHGLLSSLKASFEETKQQVADELAVTQGRLDTFQQRLDETASTIDQGMIQAVSAAEERAVALADLGIEKWKQAVETEDTHIQDLLATLEASGEKIKKQVTDELVATEDRLDALQQRLDDTASTIEQSMTQAVAAAEAQARVLADAEFEQWKQTLETGLAKTKALLSDLEASFEQTKQQVIDELTITDERMDRIQQELEDASALIEHEMAQAVDNAADKALVIADERFQKWIQATEAEEAKTQAMLAGLEAGFERTKQEVTDKLVATEGRLDTLQQQLDQAAALIEHEMAQAVGNAEEKARALADAGLEQWKQAAEGEDAKTQTVLAELEASLAQAKQQAGEVITGIEQQLETLQGRISEAAAHIEQEMTQALAAAEEKAQALGDTHFETWRQTTAEQDTAARQVLADMEASFATTKQQVADELGIAEQQFQTLQSQISEVSSHIEQDLAQAVRSAEEKARVLADAGLEQWQHAVALADTKTQALLGALEAASEETKTKAAQEHAAIEAQLGDLEAYADVAIGSLKTQVEQTLRDAEQQILHEAQAQLEPWKQTIEEADAKAQALLNALEASSQETNARLDAESTAVEQRLKDFQAYTDEEIAALKSQVEQKLQETEQQAREHTDVQLKAWTQTLQAEDIRARTALSALEVSFTATKQQVSDTMIAAEQQFQALQNRINEASAHIEQELIQATESAEEKAQVLADSGLEQWKQITAAEDAKARKILEDMEKALGDAQQQFRDAVTAAEQQAETLQNKLGEATSQLECTMTQALSTTEAQARAMADTGLEQWKQAVEAGHTQVQAMLSSLEAASAETKSQVSAEHAAIEQQLKDLQDYTNQAITGLKSHVAQTLTDTEQQVLEDTHTKLEQWTQTAAAEDAKTRTLLATLEATFTEAKTYLDTENDALEQRLKDVRLYTDEALGSLRDQVEKTVKETEQQAREEVDAKIEQWRQTVIEEETKTRTLFSTMEESFADMKRQASDEITQAERYLETLQNRIDEVSAFIEEKMAKTVDQAEAKAAVATDRGVEQWKQAAEASYAQIQQMLSDLTASSGKIEKTLLSETESMKQRLKEMQTYTDEVLIQMKRQLQEVVEEIEQKVLEEADAKVEEYRQAQAEQFSRMEALADDSAALDTELRRYMQELENRVQNDFARFEQQALQDRDRVTGEFTVSSNALKSVMDEITDELAVLKTRAYENVSEKLQIFENDFATDLTKRNSAIDQQLAAWQEALDTRLVGIGTESEAQRRNLELHFNETLHSFKDRLQQDMDTAHQKTQELIAESDARLGAIRAAIEQVSIQASAEQAKVFVHIDEQAKALEAAIKEADQHIKDFTAQTQLFERADELKQELDQRIEGLKGDMTRLEQHRAETADIEGEFVKIKRLEEEVNAKMTRFLSEKHRIEQIETDFNRLLLVSEAVEDKLSAVSTSNDTLQEMQIQIRKLTDALEDAEEKYQRIEKKNQTLDITNDGIDRNFISLQESEKMAQYITDDLHRLSDESGALKAALEALTLENRKARETADKLSLLDQSLSSIEERIEDMQKARKWLAEIETRLEKLNKEAQDQVKLMGGLMKDTGKLAPQDKGAPPLGVRDNIIRLARLGWTVDEIARAVKCGKGEVELILEIMPKG